ncbi:MAG: aminotransferase, partial [Alphaproteobacteria bacterium]
YFGGDVPSFVRRCASRGVEIKWFGAAQPKGFTSRYDSWHYLDDMPRLERTEQVLSTTCDIRVPLTFTPEDCDLIARIIVDCA